MDCLTPVLLSLSLYTHHMGGEGLNNNTPGIAIRTECDLVVGLFRNSFNKPAFHVGYLWESQSLPLRPALYTALTTGYSKSSCVSGSISQPSPTPPPPKSAPRPLTPLPEYTLTCASGWDVTPFIVPSISLGPIRLQYLAKIKHINPYSALNISLERKF